MTPEEIVALYFVSPEAYKQRWLDAEAHLDGDFK